MARKGKQTEDPGRGAPTITNSRARRQYEVVETVEAGIVLEGPEVNLDQAAELPTTVKLYPQEKWEWGWNNSSEVWNGRLAMVGFSAFLLELISGQGPLHALGLL